MLTFGDPAIDEQYTGQIHSHRKLQELYETGALAEKELSRRRDEFIAEVIGESPFYPGLLEQGVVRGEAPLDISILPVLEKEELAERCNWLRDNHDVKPFFRVQTSGSTGIPLQMYLDEGYYITYFAQFLRLLGEWGLKPSPHQVSIMTLSVFDHIPSYRILQPAANSSYGHRTNINDKHWQDRDELVGYIEEKKPLILRGMPSTFNHLANIIEDRGGTAHFRPAFLISFAEALTDTTRRRLTDLFQRPVLDEYGLTELGGVVARECAFRNGFHIHGINFYVEVVGEDNRPVPDGHVGQILVSNLFCRCMPLIRYRTGDWGLISREPCPCGSAAPRIVRIEGRALTRFIDVTGQSYNPFNEYRQELFRLPLVQFQMIQEASGRIVLHHRASHRMEGLPALLSLCEKVYARHHQKLGLRPVDSPYFQSESKVQSFLRIAE